MFSIKTPVGCKYTKTINTSSSPIVFLSGDTVYLNNQLNSSPNLSCIINSTKTVLTNTKYDPLKNPLP